MGALTEMDGDTVDESVLGACKELGATEDALEDAGVPAREIENDVPLDIDAVLDETGCGGAMVHPSSADKMAISVGSCGLVASFVTACVEDSA